MDVVTHAGIGLIAAAPFLSSRPELALGLAAGSVLPDLDALCRVGGKRAYLRWHQTWSHALPAQGLASVVTGLAAAAIGFDGAGLGLGLFAGFAIHTLLDLSNTLGVTLFAPLSRRRFCLEWVFFIDAVVLAITGAGVFFVLRELQQNRSVAGWCSAVFFAILTGYFLTKGFLRRRAGRFVPGAVSILPSALWPWRFFGTTETKDSASLFRINAITGRKEDLACYEVLDAAYAEALQQLPEFQLMRALSPAYHVVSVRPDDTGQLVLCRDLRTRNFGTTFGDLEVVLDANQTIKRFKFHV